MIELGDRILVTSEKKSGEAVVAHINQDFITVQFPNYRECFLKVDIWIGIVTLEVILDGWTGVPLAKEDEGGIA